MPQRPEGQRGRSGRALEVQQLDASAGTAVEAERGERDRPSIRAALELIGLVVAPTTLLTALAFYFGWTLTNARARYFGIDPSTLGFSTQDYLLRSTDALFVPLGAVVGLALAALIIHTLVVVRLREPQLRGVLRTACWAGGAAGAVLLGIGIAAALEPLPFQTHYLFPPLSGGLGALLLAYAVYLDRGRLSAVALGLVAALVVLSSFWTASVYADALGRGRARDLAVTLERQPHVVVYAKQRLHLSGDAVEETRLDRRDSAYAFRYDGLRLLIRSGGQYFLLPQGWSREEGFAILLRDTDELRFEFRPGVASTG